MHHCIRVSGSRSSGSSTNMCLVGPLRRRTLGSLLAHGLGQLHPPPFLVRGGVTRSGERLISEDVLQKYTTKNVSGMDKSSGFFSSLGRGFMVGSTVVSSFGWWNTKPCFGHLGGFSSLAFADHDRKLAAAIVTNGNRDFFDVIKRFLPLCSKLRKACR